MGADPARTEAESHSGGSSGLLANRLSMESLLGTIFIFVAVVEVVFPMRSFTTPPSSPASWG